MKGRISKVFALLIAGLLGGCLAPSRESPSRPALQGCAANEVLSNGACYADEAPTPVGECGCDPVACQAYYDWGRLGSGGNGAVLCAAGCQARCGGDPVEEKLDIADALAEGTTCAYVPVRCAKGGGT